MLHFLAALLCLLPLAAALPTRDVSSIEKRYDGYSPPRSVIYVQTFHYVNNSDLSLLPIYDQQTRATHIYLAAVHIENTPGVINLNDNPINDTYWDNIWSEAAQLQQDGVKVMMMLGGAAQGSYKLLCSGDGSDDGVEINEDYYGPLRDTLRYHNVDGLDLDIEERLNVSCPVALLQRLNADFGPGFILTMAPVASDMDAREYGLGGFKYSDMDSQAVSADKGKLVNWFNVQFYNGFGDASTPIGYNAIITNGWTADRIVLGVLDNKADGGSGWHNISTYQNTITTLKANFPDFGGDVGWEYWDAGGSDGFDNPLQWVAEISDAVFNGSSAVKDMTSSPIPEGQAPWPELTQKLQSLDVSHITAIVALNQTGGNFDAALQWLGLDDLL